MLQATDTTDAAIERASAFIPDLIREIGTVIVGQDSLIEALLIGLLCDGHVLIEGLPGLAKTLAVRMFAAATGLTFQRIQFTPDLLPADVVGTLVYHPGERDFVVHKGPIFANVVLADEINRAPAKVQSALLQAMEERRVTLGRDTQVLESPFLVLATQNPIEHEGTYPLPEAQLDRFLCHVTVSYPTRDHELRLLQQHLNHDTRAVQRVVTAAHILDARRVLSAVYVDPRIQAYLVDIVRATREPAAYGLTSLAPVVRYGASPRAAIHFMRAARAHAFAQRRTFVLPEDVQAVAVIVIAHRLALTYEAEADDISPAGIVSDVLGAIDIP